MMKDTRRQRRGINPADIEAEVPRSLDTQAAYIEGVQKDLEKANWYPFATGQPAGPIGPRQKAFTVDKSALNVGVQPQNWDTWPITVGTNPIEGWSAKPGQDTVMIINTGTNPVIISPTRDKANNGVGVNIGATDTFVLSTQAAGWFSSPLGTTVQVIITYFEAPSTHLPPRD